MSSDFPVEKVQKSVLLIFHLIFSETGKVLELSLKFR